MAFCAHLSSPRLARGPVASGSRKAGLDRVHWPALGPGISDSHRGDFKKGVTREGDKGHGAGVKAGME